MRAKRNGYGVQESYDGDGLGKNRAKVLLKECRTEGITPIYCARTHNRQNRAYTEPLQEEFPYQYRKY